MLFFNHQGQMLLLATVVAVGAVCWSGCGGNKDTSSIEKSEQGSTIGKMGEFTEAKDGDNNDTLLPKNSEQESAIGKTDEFIDERDDQKYQAVKMPDGSVWMAENLRFKTDDSWCYKNSEDNCNKYGRLYDWNTAKSACPKGWHLPSKNEWKELVTVIDLVTGGNKMKSTSGWKESNSGMKMGSGAKKNGNGTDNYGFSALPGGIRFANGSFNKAGSYGFWWTATVAKGDDRPYGQIISSDDGRVHEVKYNVGDAFSVRCRKD